MGDVNIFALIEDAEISGKLDLSGKVRTEVMPKEVFTLGDTLTHLNLDNNNLKMLPPDVGGLVALKSLSVYRNMLASLPDNFTKCAEIEELNLTRNKFLSFPSVILSLKLGSNQITSIDFSLACLENLLEHNNLHGLPQEIGNMKSLTVLHLDHNPITTLPTTLVSCTSLETLSLKECPLSSPPPSVVTFGVRAIMEHLSQQMNQDAVDPNMVTCEGPGTKDAAAAMRTHGSSITCLYTAFVSGSYDLTVKIGDKHVRGSPYKVIVKPGKIDPLSCIVSMPGTVVSGDLFKSNLILKDKFGNMICPDTKTPPFEVTGVNNNIVYNGKSFDITCNQSGASVYDITMSVLGKQITGSPYRVSVVPSVDQIRKEALKESQVTLDKVRGEYDEKLSAADVKFSGLQHDLLDANANNAALQSKLTDATVKAVDLETRLSASTSKSSSLDVKLTDANAKIAGLEFKLNGATNVIQELEAKLTDANNRATTLDSKLNQRDPFAAELEQRLTSTEIKLSAADNRVGDLERKLVESYSRIADMEKKVAESNKQFSELELKHGGNDTKLIEADRKLAEAAGKITLLERKLTDSNNRVLDLEHKSEKRQSISERRFSVVDVKSPEKEPKVTKSTTEMEYKLAESERKIASLNSEIDKLRKTLEDRDMTIYDMIRQKTTVDKPVAVENTTQEVSQHKQDKAAVQPLINDHDDKKKKVEEASKPGIKHQHHYTPQTMIPIPLEAPSEEPNWIRSLKEKRKTKQI